MIEFTSHASSSRGNLYTVSNGSSTLAIECGLPVKQMRKALDFGIAGLDGVLLSHHHQDHARAMRDVMRHGVDVFASRETFEALEIERDHHRAVALVPLESMSIVGRWGRWRVLPFAVRHDAAGALGFLIANGEDRLLYACDTAYVPYRFRALTHVCIECNYSLDLLLESASAPAQRARVMRYHMGLERVLTMLEANDLSRVREIHLLHLSSAHSDAEQFKATVESAAGKPTYIAEA